MFCLCDFFYYANCSQICPFQYMRRALHSDLHGRDFLGMFLVWFSSVLHCFDLKCAKWYAMRAPYICMYVCTCMEAYGSCKM